VIKRIFMTTFILIILFTNSRVLALNLDKNEIFLEAGKTKNVKLYAELPEDTVKVVFTLTFESYDIPVYFSPTNGITDETPNAIKHTLILEEASSGNTMLGSVISRVVNNPNVTGSKADIHSASAYDSEGNKTVLNAQTLYVTVGNDNDNNDENTPKTDDKDEDKTYNLLDAIKNGDNTINVLDDVFEYEIRVLSSVEELALEAVPKDEKYKVEISNQKISELSDKKITITVTNGKEKQDYIVKVKIIKDTPKVEIDDSEFKKNNSHKVSWIIIALISSVGLFFGVVLSSKSK